jgi:hypothetical protein
MEQKGNKFTYRRIYYSHFQKLRKCSSTANKVYLRLLEQSDTTPWIKQSTLANDLNIKCRKTVRAALIELRDNKIIRPWKVLKTKSGKNYQNIAIKYSFVVDPIRDLGKKIEEVREPKKDKPWPDGVLEFRKLSEQEQREIVAANNNVWPDGVGSWNQWTVASEKERLGL